MPPHTACLPSNQILDIIIIFLGPATILATLVTRTHHRAPCTAPSFLAALLAWTPLCLLWLHWRWDCLSWLFPASDIERAGFVSTSGNLTMLPPSTTTGVAVVVWSFVVCALFFALGLFVLDLLEYFFKPDSDREHEEDLRWSFSWESERTKRGRRLSEELEGSEEVRKWRVEVGSGLLRANERWARGYGTMKGGLYEGAQLPGEEDRVLCDHWKG